MSYFEGGDQTTPEGEQHQGTFLEVVKTSKGDHWADPETLAKGYVNSQDRIKELEAALAEAGDTKAKSDYIAEVLERIESQTAKPSGGESSQSNTGTENEGNQPEVSVDDIKKLITETITASETERTAKENVKETDRLLAEAYGANVTEHVEARAKQLGMGKERLQQLAEESPSAFMALMGAPAGKETNSGVRTSVDMNKGGRQQGDVRNFKHYMSLKKSDPKRFQSPKTQNQMLKDRMALGEEAFYA